MPLPYCSVCYSNDDMTPHAQMLSLLSLSQYCCLVTFRLILVLSVTIRTTSDNGLVFVGILVHVQTDSIDTDCCSCFVKSKDLGHVYKQSVAVSGFGLGTASVLMVCEVDQSYGRSKEHWLFATCATRYPMDSLDEA